MSESSFGTCHTSLSHGRYLQQKQLQNQEENESSKPIKKKKPSKSFNSNVKVDSIPIYSHSIPTFPLKYWVIDHYQQSLSLSLS